MVGLDHLILIGQAQAYFLQLMRDISMLSAGTYDLVITDANLCPYMESFLVEEPDQLVVDYVKVDNLCFWG